MSVCPSVKVFFLHLSVLNPQAVFTQSSSSPQVALVKGLALKTKPNNINALEHLSMNNEPRGNPTYTFILQYFVSDFSKSFKRTNSKTF